MGGTIDQLAFSNGEAYEIRLFVRRLAAATVLEAIGDLNSPNPSLQAEAVEYLTGEGAGVVRDLGIRCDITFVIHNPPAKGMLKASNARGKRVKLHGCWLPGKNNKRAKGAIL